MLVYVHSFKIMKKILLIAIAVCFLIATVFAAQPVTGIPDTTKTKKVRPAKVQYTCPMHHDVLSNKPGKCTKPNCGMTLIKVVPAKKTAK